MATSATYREEQRRIAALHALNVLDTEREERFDRITRLARRVFQTQAAQVNLLDRDRVWFKSSTGYGGEEGCRDTSFCTHATFAPQTMVVDDARLDERFAENPHVQGHPNIRFYAGHPITAPSGEPIGTLCVFDDKPRQADSFDAEALRELAAMAEAEIASLTLAISDELTGLSNRRGYELLGERLVKAAHSLGMPVTVLYADLDNLKPINDKLGHDAGDRAIREIARLLAGTLRDSDLIARLGGDEFAAMLAGAAAAEAGSAAARIEKALLDRNEQTGEDFELSLSLGFVEVSPSSTTTLQQVTALADEAMLTEKRTKHRHRPDQPTTRSGPCPPARRSSSSFSSPIR